MYYDTKRKVEICLYNPRLRKIVITLFWVTVVSFTLWRVAVQQIKINEYSKEYSRLDNSVDELKERVNELETQADLYSSDEHIEEVARTRLGLIRSDEIVFKEAE